MANGPTETWQRSLTVPDLGRGMSLGRVYDAREGKVIEGGNLWNDEKTPYNVEEVAVTNSEFKYISGDNGNQLATAFGLDASLQMDFLGRLLKVRGSAHVLYERNFSSRTSRVHLLWKGRTVRRSLGSATLERAADMARHLIDPGLATHVVTSVTYGGQAVFTFEVEAADENDKKEIDGRLAVIVDMIPGFRIAGDAHLRLNEEQKKLARDVKVSFVGDVSMAQQALPRTYEAAVETAINLPSLFARTYANVIGQGAPQEIGMYPIALLDHKAARLLRQISDRSVDQVAGIIDAWEGCKRRALTLMTVSSAIGPLKGAFPRLEKDIQQFIEIVNHYQTSIEEQLQTLLPQIRRANAAEIALTDLVQRVTASSNPFRASALHIWLDVKQADINQLAAVVQLLPSPTFLEPGGVVPQGTVIATASDPGISAVATIINELAVALVVPGPTEDQKLTALIDFQAGRHELKQDANPSYTPGVPDWLDMLQQFRQFQQDNNVRGRFLFVDAASFRDEQLPCGKKAVPFMALWQRGRLISTEFVPPAAPLLEVKLDHNGASASLSWSKPTIGTGVFKNYEIRLRFPDGTNTETNLRSDENQVLHQIPLDERSVEIAVRVVTTAGFGPWSAPKTLNGVGPPPAPASAASFRDLPYFKLSCNGTVSHGNSWRVISQFAPEEVVACGEKGFLVESDGSITMPHAGVYLFTVGGYIPQSFPNVPMARYAIALEYKNMREDKDWHNAGPIGGGTMTFAPDTPGTIVPLMQQLSAGARVRAQIFATCDVSLGGPYDFIVSGVCLHRHN